VVLVDASKLNDLTVYMVSGAAINDQYYSNDENNINALYAVATQNAPAIVSIDEIEVLCAELLQFSKPLSIIAPRTSSTSECRICPNVWIRLS